MSNYSFVHATKCYQIATRRVYLCVCRTATASHLISDVVMQPVRLTFREVCVSGVESEDARSLNDLSDDLLARIFAFVVGPLRSQEHFIENVGILIRHEHMQPTMVSNFDDLVVLNLVCKRWHGIVQQRCVRCR